MLKISRTLLLLAALLSITTLWAQEGARIASEELVYNFGTIAEADGLASHVFTIQNQGDSPLVITRVTASCGCTRPEWGKEPIAPGKTGTVKITYDPKGRPGPFYKTVSIFSNGKRGSYNVAIKGNVTPKPIEPEFTYPYAIGDLKLHTKNVLFSSVRPEETVGEKIHVRNEGSTSITIRIGKIPHYLTVQATPATLQPEETGTITLLLDAKAAKKMGRLTSQMPISVQGVSKDKEDGEIRVAANIIDDFSKLSAKEKAEAPIAKLSGTLLNFGKLPDKRSAVPLINRKVSGSFEITNVGQQPLTIYSVTCDDERIDLSGGKKRLKPGATAQFKVSLRPKEVKTKLEALINIVCDDPNGPIRLIKVTAHK